jgi:hypothetical protein
MPKLGGMAQLSRPLQIGVLVCAVLALAVLFALHRPGASSSGSGSSSPGVASSGGGSASSAAGGSSSVHHGSASVIEGFTHDIQRAHGAVAEVQHNAQEVQSKAAAGATAAPGAGSATGAGSAKGASAKGATSAKGAASAQGGASANRAAATTDTGSSTSKTVAGSHAASAHHAAAAAAAPSSSATAALTLHNLTAALHIKVVVDLIEELAPALKAKERIAHAETAFIAHMKSDLQPASPRTITAELHDGKTVLLLFLNPHSYDDDATAIDTVEVAYKWRHHVVAHLALASQVNSFGSITRDIQVYQTPTLLIVNPRRQVTTLTGLTNEFALEQAISEAKS